MENDPLVVLQFSCQQINCVRNKAGEIVDGAGDIQRRCTTSGQCSSRRKTSSATTGGRTARAWRSRDGPPGDDGHRVTAARASGSGMRRVSDVIFARHRLELHNLQCCPSLSRSRMHRSPTIRGTASRLAHDGEMNVDLVFWDPRESSEGNRVILG